uniref:DEK-C domain-containing protein n=1 Tax=Zea mays TaxID=4577 RepID=A0A804RLZ3_MAIZE
MVSDQEIASCVESVLRGSAGGPGEVSLTAVLQQAEATLGVDLSHKAGFIRDQMDLFFGPRLQPQPLTTPQLAPPPPQAVVAPADAVPQPQPQHQLPAISPVPVVSAPPAMAFYPPPPLAFRYTTGLAGAATGGTVSFQQPAPGAGGTASPTAAPQVAGDNKESSSKRKRGGPGGLNKVCAISPELQTIVGETAMSRTQKVNFMK